MREWKSWQFVEFRTSKSALKFSPYKSSSLTFIASDRSQNIPWAVHKPSSEGSPKCLFRVVCQVYRRVPDRYATYKGIGRQVKGREDGAKREQEVLGGEWTRTMKLKDWGMRCGRKEERDGRRVSTVSGAIPQGLQLTVSQTILWLGKGPAQCHTRTTCIVPQFQFLW